MFSKHTFTELFLIFTFFTLILTQNDTKAKRPAKEDIKEKEFKFLNNLNLSYRCKFQKNENVCTKTKTVLRYYFDMQLQRCERFAYGHCKDAFNIFPTRHGCREACQDEVFAPLEQDNLTANIFCRLQPEFGDCTSYYPSYYYDVSQQRCKSFAYSGCGGNNNRFSTLSACTAACGDGVVVKCD